MAAVNKEVLMPLLIWKSSTLIPLICASLGRFHPSGGNSTMLMDAWPEGRMDIGVLVPCFLKLTCSTEKSITALNSRSNLTGISNGTSSATTVASKIPLIPPRPNGISTTSFTFASPPTPLACAFRSVRLIFKPKLSKTFSSLDSASSPTSPDFAAVSTKPKAPCVAMPQNVLT